MHRACLAIIPLLFGCRWSKERSGSSAPVDTTRVVSLSDRLAGSYPLSPPWVGAADLDGDGRPDTITIAWDTAARPVSVGIRIAGSFRVQLPNAPADGPADTPILALDLDRDGVKDLVLGSQDEPSASISILLVKRDSLRWAYTEPGAITLLWDGTFLPDCSPDVVPRVSWDSVGQPRLSIASSGPDWHQVCSPIPRRTFVISHDTLIESP